MPLSWLLSLRSSISSGFEEEAQMSEAPCAAEETWRKGAESSLEPKSSLMMLNNN